MAWRLLGFVVAAAYWPGLPAEALVPRWSAIAIGVPLVSRLDWQAAPEWTILLFGWLIGIAALSLRVSPDPLTGAGELFFMLMLSMTFLAAMALDNLDDVMTGLGAGLAVSSIIAIVQWYGWHPVAQGSSAPAGLFYNSEVLAEFAAIIFVWAILRPRLWIAAATIVPISICWSRVAFFTAAVGLLCGWRPRWWILGLIVAGLGATAISALFVLGGDKLGSAGERVIIWIGMSEAITIMGRGLGWTTVALPRQQFMHSDALQAIVEVGIGASLLVFIPIAAFMGRRGNRAERAAFCAICAETVVSFPLRVPATGFVAALLAGVLLGRGSAVRVGECDSRIAIGADFRRAREITSRVPSPSRWRGRAISIRSRYQDAPSLHTHGD